MKCFLLATMFVLNLSVNAQQFGPLPTANAIWSAGWGEANCALLNRYDTYQYQISGDTVIGQYVYHKLKISGDFDCYSMPFIYHAPYPGAFRNDTMNERVMFVPADSLHEILLYDMTPEIGDTIKGYLADRSGNHSIIDGIDSVFNGQEYLTTWHYTPTAMYFEDGYLIEGLGIENGLLEGLFARFEFNGSVYCHSANNEQIWPAHSPAPCELVSAVAGHPENRQISIWPNPAANKLNIRGAEIGSNYRLVDLTGRAIRSGQIAQNGMVDITGLKPGMHFIHIKNSGRELTLRFLKL